MWPSDTAGPWSPQGQIQSRTLSPTHASPPHRDARDDWCSSLNEPVHLTYSLLAALILEPLLGQLLQCFLELLKGDGPAGFPSVDDRPHKCSGRRPLGPTPQVYHPFLHSAVTSTGHSQMCQNISVMWFLLGREAERKTGKIPSNSSMDTLACQGAGGSEVAWKEPKAVVIKVGKIRRSHITDLIRSLRVSSTGHPSQQGGLRLELLLTKCTWPPVIILDNLSSQKILLPKFVVIL